MIDLGVRYRESHNVNDSLNLHQSEQVNIFKGNIDKPSRIVSGNFLNKHENKFFMSTVRII